MPEQLIPQEFMVAINIDYHFSLPPYLYLVKLSLRLPLLLSSEHVNENDTPMYAI